MIALDPLAVAALIISVIANVITWFISVWRINLIASRERDKDRKEIAGMLIKLDVLWRIFEDQSVSAARRHGLVVDNPTHGQAATKWRRIAGPNELHTRIDAAVSQHAAVMGSHSDIAAATFDDVAVDLFELAKKHNIEPRAMLGVISMMATALQQD